MLVDTNLMEIYLFSTFLGEMAVDMSRVVYDSLEELWVFDEEIPVEGQIESSSIVVSCLVFGGLPMPDEVEILFLLLLMVYHL